MVNIVLQDAPSIVTVSKAFVLARNETQKWELFAACLEHLQLVISALQPGMVQAQVGSEAAPPPGLSVMLDLLRKLLWTYLFWVQSETGSMSTSSTRWLQLYLSLNLQSLPALFALSAILDIPCKLLSIRSVGWVVIQTFSSSSQLHLTHLVCYLSSLVCLLSQQETHFADVSESSCHIQSIWLGLMYGQQLRQVLVAVLLTNLTAHIGTAATSSGTACLCCCVQICCR